MAGVPLQRKEVERLYVTLGAALEIWGRVETDLTIIFYSLGGTKTRQQSSAIMDTIVSFETRMDVLDALFALQQATEADRELWAKIALRCRKLYKRRHKLAHFRLLGSGPDGGPHKPEIAPFFSHEKWLTKTLETQTTAQIAETGAAFEAMHDALLWIMSKLADGKRRKQRFRPDGEQPPELVRLRALAAQSLEERAQRAQSQSQ